MRKSSLKIWVGLLACVLISSQLVMPAQRAREVTLNEGTRITVRMNDTINTKTAHQGDRFSAEVISPVSHSGDVAIPTGSTIKGRVTQVKRPGRVKGKAELNLVRCRGRYRSRHRGHCRWRKRRSDWRWLWSAGRIGRCDDGAWKGS